MCHRKLASLHSGLQEYQSMLSWPVWNSLTEGFEVISFNPPLLTHTSPDLLILVFLTILVTIIVQVNSASQALLAVFALHNLLMELLQPLIVVRFVLSRTISLAACFIRHAYHIPELLLYKIGSFGFYIHSGIVHKTF